VSWTIRVYRLNLDATGSETSIAGEPIDTAVANRTQTDAIPPPITPSDVQPPVDLQSAELVFWDSINDSALAGDYEAYLNNIPTASLLALRARLEVLSSSESVIRAPHDEKVELLFWESVRNSYNPQSLRAYLEKFPDGEFKPLAEIRLAELGSWPK
jgi:adenylate cyclase